VLSQIDHRHVVRLLAMGRIGLGIAMLLAPRRSMSSWLGASSAERPTQVAIRALGARDLALGLGTLRSLDSGDDALRDWVTAAGACDVADAVATVLAYPTLPKRGRALSLFIAAGAGAASFIARDRLGR
jgi:hypothetical protein